MNLFIIEGAGKIKKISSILNGLNNNYKVIATCGHIERLKDSDYDNTGISKDLNYAFEYIDNKSKIMKEINDFGRSSETIYIATDPDREGEGISWHIYNKLSQENKNKSKRITFNEISEKAIKEALANPRKIDQDYVNAYLARIALDKKIGYGLSRYLQNTYKLPSAGRVQSVVLKLICEREEQIKNFVPKTTYYFVPKLGDVELKQISASDESKFTNHNESPFTFNQLQEAEEYKNTHLNNNKYILKKIGEKKVNNNYPSAPYKTSTIQAALIKELKINSKQAEKLLQELYQGGYITYPRTDATRISDDFCKEAYEYVAIFHYGLESNHFKFNKNGGGAQDAHEAIRVVHLDEKGNDLTGDLKIAYDMIYQQTIIQFMKPCITESTEYVFDCNGNEFSAKAETVIDLGYKKYTKEIKEDKVLNFELNKSYNADNYDDLIKSSTSKPPAMFNQSSLIKELEKLGIGRPSTYASSVEVNNQRKYTSIDKKEILSSTDMGKLANKSLLDNWSELINYEFTSEMEEALDKIADGKLDYKEYLKLFLKDFESKLDEVISNNKIEAPKKEIVGTCPKCGSDVILKVVKGNKQLKECTNKKWDPKTKKSSGCDFIEWIK